MRKIKFRAWHAEMKSKIGWEHICQHHDLAELIKSRHIVELYMGLEDCKGKEIYDGDILKMNSCDPCVVKYRVDYGDYVFCLYRNTKSIRRLNVTKANIKSESAEIIGNIHENPELLI